MVKPPSHVRALTLIELLAIIAIALILAAILLPVTRRRGTGTGTCQVNLKKSALGVKQYLQDYDRRFPPQFENAPGGGMSVLILPQILQPYLNNKGVWACPVNSSPKSLLRNGYTFYNSVGFSGIEPIHYVYNARLGPGLSSGIAESNVRAEAKVFMMWDGQYADLTQDCTISGWWGCCEGYTTSPPSSLIGRHLDGENYAYCDGHIKWLKSTSVKDADARFSPTNAR